MIAREPTALPVSSTIAILALLTAFRIDTVWALTLTVDDTGDGVDANAGADATCADAGGKCTLRAAIQTANGQAGTDIINFNISGATPHVIQPGSALPTPNQTTTIDGTTDPSFTTTPVIELDGTGLAGGENGLSLDCACTVRGLIINNFPGSGIYTNANNGIFEGNWIGIDADGTTAAPNGDYGIEIDGSDNNRIGGTTSGAGNVLSGQTTGGVFIGASGVSNLIQGNLIGTDVNGTADLGNGVNGVEINNADNNTIGGSTAAERNIISGNNNYGVLLSVGSTGNVIKGNYIGTNKAGTAAIQNTRGININASPTNTIGGSASGEGNVISGNAMPGIWIEAVSNGNTIKGNLIGTRPDGTTALGNGGCGIVITGSSLNNNVGGTGTGDGNTIANNSNDGVRIFSGTGNAILGNSIHTHLAAFRGIDLNANGTDVNDANDPDGGANNTQNYPVLTAANITGSTTVTGTLDSTPNTTFRIELFESTACHASGNGEGKTFLGANTNTVTDANGDASFSITVTSSATVGSVITATATDLTTNANDTSEFSSCVTVVPTFTDYTLIVLALAMIALVFWYLR